MDRECFIGSYSAAVLKLNCEVFISMEWTVHHAVLHFLYDQKIEKYMFLVRCKEQSAVQCRKLYYIEHSMSQDSNHTLGCVTSHLPTFLTELSWTELHYTSFTKEHLATVSYSLSTITGSSRSNRKLEIVISLILTPLHGTSINVSVSRTFACTALQ